MKLFHFIALFVVAFVSLVDSLLRQMTRSVGIHPYKYSSKFAHFYNFYLILRII